MPELMRAPTSAEALHAILDTVNRRDLKAVTALFADGAGFETTRGPGLHGRRFTDKAAMVEP